MWSCKVSGMTIDTQRYRNAAGQVVTNADIEREFQKARIVAGKDTAGPEYEKALHQWRGTYAPITKKEERGTSATMMTLFVCLGITAVIAVLSAMAGGVLAFIIVGVIGGLVSVGITGFVALVTS